METPWACSDIWQVFLETRLEFNGASRGGAADVENAVVRALPQMM
jgi:hypothetical protein